MDKTVLISIPIADLQTIIIDCVNSCLKYNQSQENLSSNNDQWLDVDGLREYLPNKPAKSTIYAQVSRREIPHKKVGKPLMFLRSEIDEWLKSKDRKTISKTDEEADNQLSSGK